MKTEISEIIKSIVSGYGLAIAIIIALCFILRISNGFSQITENEIKIFGAILFTLGPIISIANIVNYKKGNICSQES